MNSNALVTKFFDGSKQDEKVETTIQDLFDTDDYFFSDRNTTVAIFIWPPIPANIGRIEAYQLDRHSQNAESQKGPG